MLLISYGTRPEWLKVKPLIEICKDNIPFKVVFTGQHKDLVNGYWDYKLEIGDRGNRLDSIISSILNQEKIWDNISHVLVQGDTTSSLAIALSAINRKVKIIHLEAGLRTFDFNNPYPEEYNRQIISRIANFHQLSCGNSN